MNTSHTSDECSARKVTDYCYLTTLFQLNKLHYIASNEMTISSEQIRICNESTTAYLGVAYFLSIPGQTCGKIPFTIRLCTS